MLNETLAALASTAGTRVVTAMATDQWPQARTRTARLLSRGNAEEETRQEAQLEQARQELVGASGTHTEEVSRRHQIDWQQRFAALMEDIPEAEAPLRELVAFLPDDAARLAARAANAGLFAAGGQSDDFRYGWKPDGSPAEPWGWRDLD